MNLQKKTLLFSLIFFTVASILAGIAIKIQLYDPFIRAEQEDVFQSSAAAKTLFLQNLEDFSQSFADWSSWDDAYAFVHDLNPEFVKSNLNDESFVNLRLNLSAFTDSSGKIRFLKMYDLLENKPIQADAEEISGILLNKEIVQKVISERKNVSGAVLFNKYPALVIMRPILTSKNEGPARGILIMGRILTESETVRISRQLGFDLHFDLLKYPDGHPDFLEVSDGLLKKASVNPEAVVVIHSGTNELCGYSILNDIHGAPLMILRVHQQRETYGQYLISLFYFIALIVLFGIGGISTSLWVLHRFILLRLTKLSDQVNRITLMEHLSEMIVPGKGNDEIVLLARNINKMLTRIQKGIDEKQELQNRMVQSQKMAAVGQMAAGIAHEINNPITVIKGFAELGFNGEVLDGNPVKIYELILTQSARCSQIVKDLLTFSRMGKMKKKVRI